MNSEAWWNHVTFCDGPETEWFIRTMFADVCRSGAAIYSLETQAMVDSAALDERLFELGCRIAVDRVDHLGPSDGDVICERIYVRGDGLVLVRRGSFGNVHVSLATSEPTLRNGVDEFFRTRARNVPPHGQVLMVTKMSEGYELVKVGRVAAPLERRNYSDEVLAQYDHVAADLRSGDPCGRFVLLIGEPGTGKSHMIRGLVAEVPALFIFVPTAISGNLATPELLPLLLRYRDGGRPIVVILEDADASLLPRGTDNLDRLSDLLNAGDGLLGELMNVKLIATTNARNVELDPALLRPGRLCARIQLGALTAEHARAVYRRLGGRGGEADGEGTLAEVYRRARVQGLPLQSAGSTVDRHGVAPGSLEGGSDE